MKKLFFLYIILFTSSLFISCTNGKHKEYEYHNSDIPRMSYGQLEDVAKNSKCKECRYEALYRLYYTYTRTGTLYNLYDFAMKFPYSEFADSALAIVLPICDSLYAEACRRNTIEAWNNFIIKVPMPLQHDALTVLDSLKWETQKHKWDTDDKAWQHALKIDRLPSYERYLSLYPNGSHARQAIKKKEEIEEWYWEQQQKLIYQQAVWEEQQRQLNGDIRNVGVWAVVDSLMDKYGYPSLYHYESKGNSGIYLGEKYKHSYTIGENKKKPLSEIKKIYLRDYYKLWQNKHFDILIQFQWEKQNIIVQHTTNDGHLPRTLMKENGKIKRLPSYKSVLSLLLEKQNK